MKKDLTGKRFGRLTAIKPVGKNKCGNTLWLCRCECGGTAVCINSNLTRGNSKSCGCLITKVLIKRNTKHGMAKSRLYNAWVSMLERCKTKTATSYRHYGGRGITVCKEWDCEDGFLHFADWAMSNGYTNNLTLDRIDNNGNYCPENCRWVTHQRQMNNTRRNVIVSAFGFTASLADACRKFDAPYKRTWKRLKRGWPIEQALMISERR